LTDVEDYCYVLWLVACCELGMDIGKQRFVNRAAR